MLNVKVADGFKYSFAPQRSPEWLAIRAPRIGASEIGKYMAKGVKGQYLAGRKEVEQKIAYAKAFNVPFEGFVNGAMLAGQAQEGFILEEYAKNQKVQIESVGCAFNDWFVASPDNAIVGNGNTNSFYVLRINRNEEKIKEIQAEGESVKAIQPIEKKGVFKFTEQAPELNKSELPF